jgi:AP2-like factor (euAP2 lineage)
MIRVLNVLEKQVWLGLLVEKYNNDVVNCIMKEILLRQRKNNGHQQLFALVDDDDFERINKFKWTPLINKKRYAIYVKRHDGKKTIYLHREILGLYDNKIFVDHRDKNGLNNQRDNLRIATVVQNMSNRNSCRPSSSKFKGVSWDRFCNKWKAQIASNKKKIHIGVFDNEEDAALAYNKKAVELHGEFASLNKVA